MVDVYKRPGSPYWYFDLSVDGRRKRQSTKRTKKSEAEAVARAELARRLDEVQFGTTPEITLRAALFDHYLPSVRKAKSYPHLKTYCEYLVGDRVEPREIGGRKYPGVQPLGDGGDMKMSQLTTTMIRTYRTRRAAQGLSPQSVDHEVKCVSAAYRLVQEDFRVRQGVKFVMERPKGRAHPLLPEEETALLEALKPKPVTQKGPLARIASQQRDNYDLVVMLLDTGCRFGEIAHLTWMMVDTHEWQTVQILREKVDNEGVLAVTDRMRGVLQRRYAERRNSHYVFPGWALDKNDDLPRGSTAAIRRAMNRVGINSPAKIARFKCKRDVRSLRDTFASKVVKRVGLYGVQTLLGHTSPQMSQKYAHLAVDQTSDDAAAFLNSLNNGATEK